MNRFNRKMIWPATGLFLTSATAIFLLSHCGSSAGGPNKLIVTGATALATGPCNPYTATLQDGGGNPFNLTADVTITLSSTGSGAFFETLADCAKNNPTTTTTAKSGTSTKKIFYKDYTAESATLTAVATGLPSASLTVTVSHQAFTRTSGLNGYATGVAQDAQGRLVVAGQFNFYSATAVSNIVRLGSDGTLDATFNQGTGFNSYSNAAMVAPDGSGKIYVVGGFTAYNGTAAGRIIRLNDDGSADATFNTGTGFDSGVWSITPAVDGSGALFVGGYFGNYNGAAAAGLARLKTNGSLDTSLVQGSGFTYAWRERGIDPLVAAVLPMTDGSGRIYTGGTYRHYNGTAVTNFARLSAAGVVDTLNQGTGFVPGSSYVVTSIFDPQANGKIYVGGYFSSFNGTAAGYILRLNADGSLDTFGRNRISAGFNNWVISLAAATDGSGKIYAGGYFTNYEGTSVPYIARLNPDGSLDTTFNIGTGFNANVTSISVANDGSGKIYVTGSFTTYNGSPAPYLARLTRDGVLE